MDELKEIERSFNDFVIDYKRACGATRKQAWKDWRKRKQNESTGEITAASDVDEAERKTAVADTGREECNADSPMPNS